MLFPTYTFLWFLVVVVAVRWLLPHRAVGPWLLGASYLFYLSWGPVYGLLIGAVTGGTWALGLLIGAQPGRRKLWVWLGVGASLGVLSYYKYTQFFVNEWFALMRPGGPPPPALDIVLPLGVSFFTFQALSYVVDCYRGMPIERSLLRYALFVVFFPQLIAGPIVRVDELCPQFVERRRFRPQQFASGVDLALRGLVKKVVIADRLAEHSDAVFADPGAFGTAATWLGVLAYAGQIYCDFSGYTDIGRGAGRMLGYEIVENFQLPYLSASITEFWRRWHMTLSRWLRDYLYISLGGNRAGRARRNLNLMITMVLGGLWHGAGWTFVLWGFYHGALLILHKAWLRLTARLDDHRARWYWRVPAIACTFLLVVAGWVAFRAPDVKTMGAVFAHLRPGVADRAPVLGLGWTAAILAALAAGHALGQWRDGHWLWAWIGAAPGRAWLRGGAWALAAVACFFLAGRPAEFIYFAF